MTSQPLSPLKTSTLRSTPSGSMRLPVRRPAVRGTTSPVLWSTSSSTGTSVATISETRQRANLAPIPPPSPVECQEPKIKAVGDTSSNAEAFALFAVLSRLPMSLSMNGFPSKRLSRKIASYTRCGASSEVILLMPESCSPLKFTTTCGMQSEPSPMTASRLSSSRLACDCTLSTKTHQISLPLIRRRSKTWRGGALRPSPG